MSETDLTTRTPEESAGDDPTGATAEATPGDVRPDPAAGDDQRQREALANKVKAEAMNELMERYGVNNVADLKVKLAQSPAAQSKPAETKPDPNRKGVKEWATEGDTVAQAVLELSQNFSDELAAREVADPVLRQAIWDHYNRHRDRLGDYSAAMAEVLAPKLAKEKSSLAKENEELRAQLKTFQKPPDPDVASAPKTGGREITATSTTKTKMRGDEFDARVAALEAAGKYRDALKLRQDYFDGKIEVS